MAQIQERGSTHVYRVNKISKEEMESMVARCVYEHPPFCSAACPLKLDARAFLEAAAAGNFKKALLICPGFSEYEKALLVSGCEDIRFYMCTRENGFRVGEEVLDLITEEMDMMYLCNPGNPTGILVRQDLVLRILERCREKGVLLVVDECFLELTARPEGMSSRFAPQPSQKVEVLRFQAHRGQSQALASLSRTEESQTL